MYFVVVHIYTVHHLRSIGTGFTISHYFLFFLTFLFSFSFSFSRSLSHARVPPSDLNGPYYGGPGASCFDNGYSGGACGYNVHNGLDTYGTGGNHNGKCGSYFISCYGTTTYLNGGQGQGTFWVRADTFGTTSAGFPFTSGSPGETITWTADPIISGVTSLRLLLQSKGSECILKSFVLAIPSNIYKYLYTGTVKSYI